MNIRKISLIKIAAISFLLPISWSTSAYAQPQITGFSESLINGSPITITGSGFGINGPTILLFDDFESGTNGSNIKTGAGSATIGQWDGIGAGDKTPASLPRYDNRFKVSGGVAFRGNATIQTLANTTDAGSPAYTNFTATSDIFVSYWYYMPSTSDWPCYNNDSCNNKLVWVVNTCCSTDDRVIPANSGGDKAATPNLYMFGNNAIGEPPLSPPLLMSKGTWYRFWVYLHGAGNTTDHEELWIASPSSEANLAATRRINRTTQIWQTTFAGFKTIYINAYQRWCNDCAESAPTFDDVYVATGTGAQARVEIGDAATYTASKNLTIATITSWSDTSITATIRQGSFSNLYNAYLYVIDANGNVNTNGYLLDTQAPTVPAGLSAQAMSSSQINLSWTASTDNVGVTGYRIYRDGVLIDTSATNSYSDTGLSASTTYAYSVSAYDAVGNMSSQSGSASATTSSSSGGEQTGDTEISAGGCGFVKGSGDKGDGSNGNVSQALSFIMMLLLILSGLSLARRYNTPKKLDRGLRWMVVCRNSKEGRQDGKEKDV